MYIHILINGERLITDVQKQFASAYPFLKIEFFKRDNTLKSLKCQQTQIAHNVKLKEAWTRKKAEGDLIVNDVMTVFELENTFMDRFGLTAHLFRRSGNIWLQTSITDNWTLKQQNDMGREITIGRKTDNRNENDYESNRDPD
jgi:hypothetical protein